MRSAQAPVDMRAVPVPMYGQTVYRNVKVEVDEAALKQIASDRERGQYYRATDSKSLRRDFQPD